MSFERPPLCAYTVRYHAGTYSGTRVVLAEDSDHACDIVRAWVRRNMTLPMYSDSYRVVQAGEDSEMSDE